MPDSTKGQQPKLLDQVRQVLRLHHYSIHTERSYVDWIVRFVRFHSMRSREHLFPAEAKIESFLTDPRTMIWYKLSGASSLNLSVMAEHYQKRIEASRYLN